MSGTLPQLNPVISNAASQMTAWFKSVGTVAATATPGTLPWLYVGLLLLVGFAVFVYYLYAILRFESPANINRIGREATQAQRAYAVANPTRVHLRDYLSKQTAAGITSDQFMLCNFYISTVNTAGLYFPARNGVINPEAVRTAVLAGARAFVFDIYPNLLPGANFTPIVQVVEAGSKWRRISLNQASFTSLLRPLIEEAFEIPTRPGREDPVFLYLRFRGTPHASTFQGVADALRALAEPYRLDASYNACRRANALAQTPISQLFKKMLIFSNIRSSGTAFDEYVNAAPVDGRPLEIGVSDLKGQSEDSKTNLIKTTRQNIVWVAAPAEGSDAENNTVALNEAYATGIQCVALNFWKNTDSLKTAMAPAMFGRQSFAIKPIALRLIPEYRPAPSAPSRALNIGTGNIKY